MESITRIFLLTFAILCLAYFLLFDYSKLNFYWHDEAFILQHISGKNRQELVTSLYDGRVKDKQELSQFQGVNNDRGLVDVIKSVAQSSAEQPPLYFTLLWSWAKLFGNQEKTLMVLAFLLWLGFITSLYYLILTIFNSHNTATIITFLIAISPRFWGLSTDIREYGLFALMTTLSSLFLLKSFQFPHQGIRWLLYGLSLAAGLWTHIFFIFVAFAQLIYFLVNDYSERKTKKSFWITYCLGWAAFFPWLFILMLQRAQIYAWAKNSMPLPDLLNRWILTFSTPLRTANLYLNYLFLAALFISIYLICKKLEKKYYSFLILLSIVPFISLALWDLVFATKYSSVGRFYLPTLLGISICFYYLISLGMQQKNKIIKGVTLIVVGLIVMDFFMGIGEFKKAGIYQGYGSNSINSSFIIQESSEPLVLGEIWFDLFPLSYKLSEKTHYLFLDRTTPLPSPATLANYSEVYVLNPSRWLKQALEEQGMKLTPTSNPTLWLLKLPRKELLRHTSPKSIGVQPTKLHAFWPLKSRYLDN